MRDNGGCFPYGEKEWSGGGAAQKDGRMGEERLAIPGSVHKKTTSMNMPWQKKKQMGIEREHVGKEGGYFLTF